MYKSSIPLNLKRITTPIAQKAILIKIIAITMLLLSSK